MDRREFDERWMAREPVEGVAFLLNDSVRVTAGVHSGSCGRVVSLVEMAPQPLYAVKLRDGTGARVKQADLITANGDDAIMALARLQRWYSAQCDGDWEHQLGVRIETLDNPGWMVTINLEDTPLETADFPERREMEDAREWIHCRVTDSEFRGDGGPNMLGVIIESFVRWADGASQRTG